MRSEKAEMDYRKLSAFSIRPVGEQLAACFSQHPHHFFTDGLLDTDL
jgi:hypothetical protein